MRKIVVSSIAALAGLTFASSGWAGEGCAEWGDHTASTKPVVTADSGKSLPQTPIATDSKKGG
jgi:hypothetical protein